MSKARRAARLFLASVGLLQCGSTIAVAQQSAANPNGDTFRLPPVAAPVDTQAVDAKPLGKAIDLQPNGGAPAVKATT